ncbi:MAG: DUF3748 domain-containing protein [Bacteroidota bacterium]
MSYKKQTGEADAVFKSFSDMEEIHLTSVKKGHFLHTTQYFSQDDSWIVYDTRNDGTHIGRTCCIEAVNVRTEEIKQLYQTRGQTIYGPGVGSATFNPVSDRVLFIHGLQNCDSVQPYGFYRRTGVAVDTAHPGKPIFMDGRDVFPPFTAGALRGGTHAHTWSADGQWVSFTYNDAVMAELESKGVIGKKDLRMVGVMAPYGPVKVGKDGSGENIDGEKYTVVVTDVTEDPEPGSDQIDRAYEDGWVGTNGYMKEDGSRQKRAVAFLGDIRDQTGNKRTEVFIADIPDDVTKANEGKPLTGTETTRPNPPAGTIQRRLTFTTDRKYPGVQGPRHWLRSTPDGSMIFFMMKDKQGMVQIYGISPNGGWPSQITDNNFSVETGFNVSPDGMFLAYGSQQRIYITHIKSGQTRLVSPEPKKSMAELRAVNWSNDGNMLAYNRKIAVGDTAYYQTFILK